MERVVVGKRAHEDGHLSSKARETGKTQIGQTGNHIAYAEEWHDLHQTAQFTNVASMSTAVYHTDEGKEQSCHQTMRKHLQNSTRTGGVCHHEQGEQN